MRFYKIIDELMNNQTVATSYVIELSYIRLPKFIYHNVFVSILKYFSDGSHFPQQFGGL